MPHCHKIAKGHSKMDIFHAKARAMYACRGILIQIPAIERVTPLDAEGWARGPRSKRICCGFAA